MRRVFAFALALLIETPALAAAPRTEARIVSVGEESTCPRVSELAQRVNELSGRAVFGDGPAGLTVFVEHAASSDETTFRLVRADGAVLGTRSVRASEVACTERRDRLALVLSLMLDLPEQERSADPRAVPRFAFAEAEFGVVGGLGLLPAPRTGLFAGLRVKVRPLVPVSLGFVWWPTGRFSGVAGDYQLKAWMLDAALNPALIERDAFRVGVVTGARFGRFYARGLDFAENRSAVANSFELEAELDAALRVGGPLFARIAAGAAVPLLRPTVTFADATGSARESYRAASVCGIGSISLFAHF